jgi:hypothetical protein
MNLIQWATALWVFANFTAASGYHSSETVWLE